MDENGFAMTRYEKEIYDIINASHEHLRVEQVFERLRDQYPKVVLATVYNNLKKLWENGLIRKLSAPGLPDRYDRIERHDHLVCKNCGALSDLVFDDLTELLRERLEDDFFSYDLKVYHLCPACRAKRQNK